MVVELMAQITPLNSSLITTAVATVRKSLNLDRDSAAFIHLMLDRIYPTKEPENSDLITDGSNDLGVDAIYIRQNEQGVHVDIMSFKYRETPKSCEKNFEAGELDKLRRFIDDLHRRNSLAISNANAAIRRHCEAIWSFFQAGVICHFKIIIVTNGLGLSDSDRAQFEHYCQSHHFLTFDEIDYQSVIRLVAGPSRSDERATLATVDYQIFDRVDGDVRGVVANVDAISLIKAIEDPQTGSIKRHIFDDNIRIYLGDEGGYNRNIISSALDDDNHLFWYLNNGVTIICRKLSFQKNARNTPLIVENFQIVNGAQTCNALYTIYRKAPDKLAKILLLVKVYETNRDDISNRVAIATNSQARINVRDLRANDDIQKKIEKIINSSGLFYERKKNQFSDRPTELRVDALKLGQMILSFYLEEPDKAKTDSDQIFGLRYEWIFNDRLTSESLIHLINIFREIEKRRDGARALERTMRSVPEVEKFLSYGQWYILYSVKKLIQRDNLESLSSDLLSYYVDEAQRIVTETASEYKTWAHYDMFRSSKFREKLDSKYFSGQLNMFPIV
jgi:AIPR protein